MGNGWVLNYLLTPIIQHINMVGKIQNSLYIAYFFIFDLDQIIFR